MITQDEKTKSVGTLPFSSADVDLIPRFDDVSLGDILDTFGLIAEGIERAEAAVCVLREKVDQASEKGRGKTHEELVMSRYTLVREADLTLPLLATHLGALKMTALALVEGLRGAEYTKIVIPGERR